MAISYFPHDLPARPEPQRSWKDRNCPGMRGLWSFSLKSFNPMTPDKATMLRRICMIIVLGLRTAMSVMQIILDAFGSRFVSLIVGIILAVIGFFFIAWCLAQIGEATGYRKVLGARVGRWHYDVFLLAMAIIHLGVFIGGFFGINANGYGASWLVLWLAIFLVAWVTTWAPEPESHV